MTDLTEKLRQHAENRKRLGGHPCGYNFLLEAADLIEQQAAEIGRLRRYVAALESKRPHWAEGFSSDSVAAQLTADALTELWGLLGVHNQTEAVEKLKTINQQVKL